jgi:hypothetical protein
MAVEKICSSTTPRSVGADIVRSKIISASNSRSNRDPKVLRRWESPRSSDLVVTGGLATSGQPTDVERAAGRVDGVRPGCAVAVRLDAGHSRESFAVAVESNLFEEPREVRRIKHQVAHQVVAEIDAAPRNVVVLGPGVIPNTPSGKLRRAYQAPARATTAWPSGVRAIPSRVNPALGQSATASSVRRL